MNEHGLQIKSKSRVTNFGEVNTNKEIVNNILDLVSNETTNLESRFLEPACGDGNFLRVVLDRKLKYLLSKKLPKNKFEKLSILICSTIYGIDLIPDNIEDAIKVLTSDFQLIYKKLYKNKINKRIIEIVKYIFKHNIVVGNAISMKLLNGNSIVFPEWSFINSDYIKRRDFEFKEILNTSNIDDLSLFKDLGEDAFLAKSINEFKAVHYLSLDAF